MSKVEPEAVVAAIAPVRRPTQQRSKLRFEMLLNAADALLVTRETTEVGLYDIAAQAGVPPASVYHLFPTKEACFVALAERYLQEMAGFMLRRSDLDNINSWQDFIALEMGRAGVFYNDHPVMAKLFFGANVVQDVRSLDARNVQEASVSTYVRLNKYFEMPYLRHADLKFAAMIGIYDGIWMTSYCRHGYITEAFAKEAEVAALAYCETFLPMVVPMRPPRPSPT
jgi:AcrR family transcriptional regulator